MGEFLIIVGVIIFILGVSIEGIGKIPNTKEDKDWWE